MAALTQQPLVVREIRGASSYPGLDFEDLVVLRALAHLCEAETTGAELKSSQISFLPTRRLKGWQGSLSELKLPKSERGISVPTVLHCLLPALAGTGVYSTVAGQGETHGHNSLDFEYFENVTLMAYRKMGLYAFPTLNRAGFGRSGRGEMSLDVEPSALNGFTWKERGKLTNCKGVLTLSGLGRAVAQRGVSHLNQLASSAKMPLEIEVHTVESDTPGCFITLWAAYENGFGGSTGMGAKGVRMEMLAQGVFEELYRWMRSDAAVDPFLADQLLVGAVMAEGETTFTVARLTRRFLTMAWVIKQFLPIHLTILGAEGEPGSVSIRR